MNTVAESPVEAYEYYPEDLVPAEQVVRRASLERRNNPRKSVAVHARITIPGKSVLAGHTLEISRAGASITLPFELAQGQTCLIDLELQVCGENRAFHIPGEIRYCVSMANGEFRAGVRFGETDAATSAFIASISRVPV